MNNNIKLEILSREAFNYLKKMSNLQEQIKSGTDFIEEFPNNLDHDKINLNPKEIINNIYYTNYNKLITLLLIFTFSISKLLLLKNSRF